VCNEAALIAARYNKKSVGIDDFNAAVDRIIGGLEKKSKITTTEEKRGISVHEAGHANRVMAFAIRRPANKSYNSAPRQKPLVQHGIYLKSVSLYPRRHFLTRYAH